MTREALLAALICLTATACEKDPAKSVRIIERPATPPASATSSSTTTSVPPSQAISAAPKPTPAAAPLLPACPPPPEDQTGSGTLTARGPCEFKQTLPASCEALADDFIMVATRTAKNGATVMIYINVETYHGPDKYKDAQMFVGVQDKVNIWRWSSDAVNITVGPREAFADLPSTRLEGEPMLVDCTGPMTNFQCSGRGESAFDETVETVSGRLPCEPAPKTEK